MASRFGIDSALTNRLGQDHSDLFFAVKMEFDSGTLRLWTGIDDLTLNSETYTGAGSLLSISALEDENDLSSKGIAISLSGMDSTISGYAVSENYQNRLVTIYLGFLSGGTESAGELVIFKGRMMNMSVNDNPDNNIITLEAENRLIDLEKPSHYRYTKESQQSLFSGDLGMNFVSALQNAQLNWGPVPISGGSLGGGMGNRSRSADNFIE